MLGLTTAVADKAYPPPEVLSGHWWQWALSIPAAINPITDATGEFAAVGQSGPVWYLAGNFGGTTVRTVTVPADKALFFPILNYFAGGFHLSTNNTVAGGKFIKRPAWYFHYNVV